MSASTTSPERFAVVVARIALAIIFLWFGILKLKGVSPVIPIIAQAYPFITAASVWYLMLGWFEVAVGIGILVPRLTTLAGILIIGHLIVASAGVLFSPQSFVSGFPILSVVGEFVIKNIALVALALMLIVCNRRRI